MATVEKNSVESLEERVFTVGEVVEYWEGAFVRGERLGSGEPGFVKRVEGNGVYAIKMVGSSRGKFRICGWQSLFKDGSFTNNVARKYGARVRGDARLRERAKEEAEAKLGGELRQTKRELQQIEKQNKAKEKESEDRQKRDEIVTRTAERDREKAERERREKHKRQVEELHKELEQDREEENRATRQLIRELRQDLKIKVEELIVVKEGSMTLQD
jgi:DNA repair exonuclease SbcCD ATPase subunit